MIPCVDMLEMGMYSAIAPLVLLLVTTVWKYPAVLEEVVKYGIMKIGAMEQPVKTSTGLVVGLVFGLSEAILYTANAWASAQWAPMVLRLVLTVPMHTVTAIVIAWAMQKRMGWIGLFLAMLIHGMFNYFIQ